MRRFRELTERDERTAAAQRIAQWGYHRDVSDESDAIWSEFGPDVLVWWVPSVEDGRVWSVHVCASPASVGRLANDNRRLVAGIEILAEFLGAEVLAVRTPLRHIQMYLRRMGWTDAEPDLLYKPLANLRVADG